MRLTRASLRDTAAWAAAETALPRYDAAAVAVRTGKTPRWVHFGVGNIFRGFIAGLAHRLLDGGLCDTGVIAAETFDFDIIDQILRPHDNLCLNVTLKADGGTEREIFASVAEALRADRDGGRLAEIFARPSLQMVSFTITEKGYAVRPGGAMEILTGLLYRRYQAGGHPIALCSMDNCSANGDRLKACVLESAETLGDKGFRDWLNDRARVSFPWSMIDKITPRPDRAVQAALSEAGIEGMEPLVTSRQTYIAAFVNAERPQYLVVEDAFPNGRPPLERAGVFFADRETVSKAERMKVTACLNPLHTALAVFGCLLGYTRICDEMADPDLLALVRRLGYQEGLPVVEDPGILSPRAFLDEVLNERLPNPFIPDTPQRIATDTSQKVGIRFGETIRRYLETGRSLDSLVAVPLTLAGWLRYLQGTDDRGQPAEISPDPLGETLRARTVAEILADSGIFGLDLTQTPLGGRILGYWEALSKGPGAVRETLNREVSEHIEEERI
jgi:fructuronate reductase